MIVNRPSRWLSRLAGPLVIVTALAAVGLLIPLVAGHDPLDLLAEVWRFNRRVFPLSDCAGLLGGLTRDVSALVIVAVLLVPVTAYALRCTRAGLRLRAVGERPEAARSAGVDAGRVQVGAVLASGVLAGLGGVFVVLEGAGQYREGQVGGRGFIGLAAVVFGHWRPTGVAAGAGLFGYADAIQLREARALRAVLLVASIAFVALAGRAALRRRPLRGAAWAAAGVGFAAWFAAADTLPLQLMSFTPHLATLVVLALATRPSSRPPPPGPRSDERLASPPWPRRRPPRSCRRGSAGPGRSGSAWR